MPKIADRVKETSTSTGTGTINLGGAATGYRAFSSAFVTADVVYYCIEDGTNWEVGYGTLTTGTPWTLSRNLLASSSGSLSSFSAGTKNVFCTSPASYLTSPTLTSVKETRTAPTIGGGTLTLDLSGSSIFDVSLNAAITTLTISNPAASGTAHGFVLTFTADGTARAVTWPAAVKWPAATAPTITSTNNKKDCFVFMTTDGGTSYHGFVAGQNL